MWGKNQLEISWGSIFAVGHFHSSWGKTPAPRLLLSALHHAHDYGPQL